MAGQQPFDPAALTVLGSMLWAAAFVAVGIVAAGAWATVGSLLGRALLGAGLLILAASVLRRRRARDPAER